MQEMKERKELKEREERERDAKDEKKDEKILPAKLPAVYLPSCVVLRCSAFAVVSLIQAFTKWKSLQIFTKSLPSLGQVFAKSIRVAHGCT